MPHAKREVQSTRLSMPATLLPVEKFLIQVSIPLLLADLALIAMSPAIVDWVVLLMALALVTGAFVVGHLYRYTGRDERIGLTLTGAGLFILGSVAGGMLSYLLVPFVGERIDPWLIQIDHLLGFDWPSFVEWMSHHPRATWALGPIYESSLLQLVLLLLVLGFGGHTERLHHFLLTAVFATLGTIGFWAILPSSGPSAFLDLPQGVLERVSLVVEPTYGAELNQLMTRGLVAIPPPKPLGLVAFPSFHTVMALMMLWFMPRRSLLFWPIVVLNLAMIPAILLHGGHYLIDILGGIGMFFVALCVAGDVARRLQRDQISSYAVTVAAPQGQ
jgi:hypothetical protein